MIIYILYNLGIFCIKNFINVSFHVVYYKKFYLFFTNQNQYISLINFFQYLNLLLLKLFEDKLILIFEYLNSINRLLFKKINIKNLKIFMKYIY